MEKRKWKMRGAERLEPLGVYGGYGTAEAAP
jgi:hypothetical protein